MPIESYEREALELAAILDTMADGVFVIDGEHTILRWNSAMARLTGYTAEEAVGRTCSFLRTECANRDQPFSTPLDCDLFAAGQVERTETRIRRKDGRDVPVIASARVMRDPDGGPLGAVVTLTDISSLKRLEDQVHQLQREVETRFEMHNIVGKSRAMQEVFSLIELAAASAASVLITGETGTGKELAAKAIHFHSDRRDKPFVGVNCSALSESLLESELFGHVRGAFTGAIRDHQGRFELADGGSIFLDEIGDVPPLVQVKLLRVLQEREFERVGDIRTRKVDVRVLAATNKDLRSLVQRGEFREDLFYRLKVFPIHLPPLRERKEDIELLLQRFIERFAKRTGKPITGLTPDAMRIIMDYCWQGNVRELENAVEHAFVTCPGGTITPFDLPVEIRRVELQRQICQPAQSEVAVEGAMRQAEGAAIRARRRPVTREALIAALESADWNKAEAARRLGLTRTSIWRRMKALGIPLEP